MSEEPSQPTEGPPEPGPSSRPAGWEKKPIVCIVIGMAGSGKTTLMQRFNAYLHAAHSPPYVINLDPAVTYMPYGPNIDIRDTVDYKEVMKQYKLGPNGGILTSLNLFATRFDQVMQFVENRAEQVKYVLVDTPGQIEIFTWSASGAIISESLASSFPTVVLYIVDIVRSSTPTTFMSNMLYACSVMYKTKLPFVLVFNKIDVVPHTFALDWMADFDTFQAALEHDSSYVSSLTRSMALTLDQFYRSLNTVGVSAMSGAGMDDLVLRIQSAALEYFSVYKPELDNKIAQKSKAEEERKRKEMDKLRADLEKNRGHLAVPTPGVRPAPHRPIRQSPVAPPTPAVNDEDQDEDDDDDGVGARVISEDEEEADEDEGEYKAFIDHITQQFSASNS